MTSTRTTTRARGIATRRRLLEATIDLVCERGAAGTSVGAVCERAGCVKTALYWHFGSKEGLLRALVDVISRVVSSELAELVSGPLGGRQPADVVVDALKHFVCKHKTVLQVLQVLVNERANLSEAIRLGLRDLNRVNAEVLAQGFAANSGREDPRFELLAFSAIGLTFGSLWMHQLDPDRIDLERMVDHLRDLVNTYLARDRETS